MGFIGIRLSPLVLFAGVLAGSLAGQEEEQDAPAKRPVLDRAAKLKKACAAMSRLQSLSYSTTQKTTNRATNFVIRGAAKPRFKAFQTSGVWSGDLLFVDIGEEEQLVFRDRRMIARDDDTGWSLRRGRLANGKKIPFALDPGVLFAVLGSLDHKVVHNEVGAIRNLPVETYTIRLEGESATELLWSGVLPEDRNDGSLALGGAGGGAVFVRAIGAAAGGASPNADRSVDLAISFDPATKRILRITGRSFTEVAGAGMVRGRVLIGGAGGGFGAEQEDDEEDEEEQAKPGTYKDGLPVPTKAKLKKSTVVDFTFDFRSHDQTKPRKLNPTARKLLGLQPE